MSDAFIVSVTIYHTYGAVKASKDANMQATFSSTLLRAGQVAYSYNDMHWCFSVDISFL